MPVACKLIDGKWRQVEPDGKPANESVFADEGACQRAAFAMNASKGDRVLQGVKDLENAVQQDGAGLVFEKEVIYEGTFFDGDVEFSVDKATFDHWASTHQERLEAGVKTPLPSQHTQDTEANRGYVLNLISKKNSKGKDALFAVMEFRDAEAAKMASSADVSLYSPVTDFAAGRVWQRPISHIALTNYPVVPGLGDFTLVASLVNRKKEPQMDPLKKLAGDLQLSIGDGQDPAALILSTFQAMDSKIKELEKRPPVKDPVHVSKVTIELSRENREGKIEKLLREGKVSSAVAKQLEETFASEKALTLSLSDENYQDNFNAVLEMFRNNDPVSTDTASGPQVLELAKNELLDPEKNPLHAAIKRQHAAANQN